MTKAVRGTENIIVKGGAGNRHILRASRFLPRNPLILKLAIGKAGIRECAKRGGVLTIVLYTSIDVAKFILLDNYTLTNLAGELAWDLISVGTSTIAFALAGLAIGSSTTIASIPLGIAILVGVYTGLRLNALNDHYEVAQKLGVAMRDMLKQIPEDVPVFPRQALAP